MALHVDEFPIDDSLVRKLLADQFPDWSSLPLNRLETSGTVNIAYRLGPDKLIRLPRTAAFAGGPEREARWMPVFAPAVPLQVPEHLALGSPSEEYPSHWSVLRWIDGTTADDSSLGNLHEAAVALGEFVMALRKVPTEGAPPGGNYRGFGLSRIDQDFRRWASRLPPDVDQGTVIGAWESCLSAEEWAGPPTWFHSDLRGDNLIAAEGNIVAVIDWEGCTVGDPSADYLAAWWLFEADSRETFRSTCRADQADWQRARGWALHMAVAAIPYYSSTNLMFVAQAKRALGQILVAE